MIRTMADDDRSVRLFTSLREVNKTHACGDTAALCHRVVEASHGIGI
jgi:hypothetical protein